MKIGFKNHDKEAIRENKQLKDLELAPSSHANGNLGHLKLDAKVRMIKKASKYYGKFLSALGCDWRNDPNSSDTPMRVAKTYVEDLWKGRYTSLDDVISFPSDGYDGLIIERNIPIISVCSHHHQIIKGKVHIGYISTAVGRIIGLSKLNRVVENFSRRGAIQEQLTNAIHNVIDKICKHNQGVIITMVASHNCISCRGINHDGTSVVTTKASGVFMGNESRYRKEFFTSLLLP